MSSRSLFRISPSLEIRRAFFQERAHAFLTVVAAERGDEQLALQLEPAREWRLEGAAHRRLRKPKCDRGMRSDVSRHLERSLLQLGVLAKQVDQANALRFFRADHLAGQDQPHRTPETDEPRQPLRATASRQNSQLDLGLS